MGENSDNSRVRSFGLLGSVEITMLEYEAPDVYAKLTASQLISCPAPFAPAGDSGPAFSDDQGCGIPLAT